MYRKMVNKNPEQTRSQLLNAAFDEINQNGFQAASLNNILRATNMTKGALYHHFPSKMDMGYAVVDELIKTMNYQTWVEPLINNDNIIEALIDVIELRGNNNCQNSIYLGCPLNNLAQEMSAIDEGFRQRINGIFDEWREAIELGLKHGQKQNIVRHDISPRACAYFIVATIEGAYSLAKNAQSAEVLETSLQGLIEHIKTLQVTKQH